MNDEIMIQVTEFSKSYGTHLAVDNVSLEVRRGEIFGLLGPNGAGKTTTLECLEGMRQPGSGSLKVAGLDPSRENRRLCHLIGVQLQSASLPASITPVEAMRLFCSYHRAEPRLDLLERLQLTEKRNSQYCDLSTGQQRRLTLALAVAHDPPMVFLDEPTAGLDVATRVELHEMMHELKNSGTTILLATHDMAEAEQMSDRVAILLNGRLAKIGTPLEITATGAGLTKISVQTQADCLKGVELAGVDQHLWKDGYHIYFCQDIGTAVSAIINQIQTRGDSLIDLRVERPSLEDRFLEITRTGGEQ